MRRPANPQRRGWIYVGDDEPDPRFTLANERTFLAWIRTAIALIVSGVVVVALGIPGFAHLQLFVGCVLVGAGALSAMSGFGRWARAERALRLGSALPRFRVSIVLVSAVALSGIFLIIALVW